MSNLQPPRRRNNTTTPYLRAIQPQGLSWLAKACCEMSRRDGAIVAWHEVPGTAPPQKSRPVGYGLIRAGVRTDLAIGVTKFGWETTKHIYVVAILDHDTIFSHG
jgi:hypothetical protein